MQSKREPPSLLELSEFYRQKREHLLHGNRCTENQAARMEKTLYQNASRRMKSLPSQQPPKQQVRETKSFPLFTDKGQQRNETISSGSMQKISAERESATALIQQVSKQRAKEENWLFIPTGSAQPGWVSIQHISGQPMQESTTVANQELTGHPARKMRWIPIQPQTLGQPQIQRASEQLQTETRLVLTDQISGQPTTEAASVATEQITGHPTRKKIWITIQHESLGQSQIQRPSGPPARETRRVTTQQTSGQFERQMRRVHIQQSSKQPARETRSVPIHQSSGKRVKETSSVPIQQTLGQPKWVPTPPPTGKPTNKPRSQPSEQAPHTLQRYTRLPPIQQTFGVNRSEPRASATKETARLCQQLTRNEESPGNNLERRVRRQGRQEAYPTAKLLPGFSPRVGENSGNEVDSTIAYYRTRRQGVCRQTDETEAQRTFVRVLNKRF